MYKIIIFTLFSSLFVLLAGCGNDKLPEECQEALDVLEKIDVELDTNIYVTDDLRKNFKHAIKLNTYAMKKRGGANNDCNTFVATYKGQLEFLKNAKSEDEVNKRFEWVEMFRNRRVPLF